MAGGPIEAKAAAGPTAVMARMMYHYVIPVDDQPHVFPLSHSPVAVAATGSQFVEFWAEHTEGAPKVYRAFQVFGTGHPLPDDARWVGTCARTALGLVWHLYERDGA
jgi:hypothetical protein